MSGKRIRPAIQGANLMAEDKDLKERARELAGCDYCAGSGKVMVAVTAINCPRCEGAGTRRLTLDELAAFAASIQEDARQHLLVLATALGCGSWLDHPDFPQIALNVIAAKNEKIEELEKQLAKARAEGMREAAEIGENENGGQQWEYPPKGFTSAQVSEVNSSIIAQGRDIIGAIRAAAIAAQKEVTTAGSIHQTSGPATGATSGHRLHCQKMINPVLDCTCTSEVEASAGVSQNGWICSECGRKLNNAQVTTNFGNRPLCKGGCPTEMLGRNG